MKRILFLILLMTCTGIFGQKKSRRDSSSVITQPKRIEFLRETSNSEFTLVNGKEHGLLVIENTEKAENGNAKWKISVVDTALELSWNATLGLPFEYSLKGCTSYKNDFMLLFQKSLFGSEDLVAYKINALTQELSTYDITTVFPVELEHFETIDDLIILAGYANYRPVVITYDLHDRIPRILPGFYDNKNRIIDVTVDAENELFSVITSEKMITKYYTVRFRIYTTSGALLLDTRIDPGEKRSIIDAAITNFSGGLQYLAGIHSKRSPDYSQGFYLSKFINGQQQLSKYYPFADLQNFFSYLKPKKEERIKSRIDRKKEKGKTKKFSYRLLVHKILEYENEYIMVAEAYYPKYAYPSNTSFSYGYMPNALRNALFLGYVWTHAVVVAFDQNCNILWDNTFKIEDRISYSLDETVQVSKIEDNIILNYLEENEIRTKVINREGILEGKTFNPIRLSLKTDRVRDNDHDFEYFERWFGNTSIAFGEQAIRNPNGVQGMETRKVFYINTVKYDLHELIN